MDRIETEESYSSSNIFLSTNAILYYLAFTKLLIHLVTNIAGGYGYFRDEFYYIACSNHMAWGYVDQPPLSIGFLWLNRLLLGDSLFALRFLPAIAGAVVVLLAGLITKELGGKRYAQMLVACCVIFAPLILGTNSYYSMNSFDILFWTLSVYLLIIILKNDDQKKWLLLGLVLGLGLLNKISVIWLGAGLAVGLLLTPNRVLLRKPNVWLAAAIAFILFLPYIIWEAANGYPTLEFIKNATANKYVAVSPLKMFTQQLLNMNPATFIIWIPGLIYFLVSKSVKQFKILPIIYFTVFLILIINKNSKSEYLGSMFPMLFAMGAVTIERFIFKFNWNSVKYILIALVAFSGIVFAPFAIAILPVETFIAYSKELGVTPSTSEKKGIGRLPQFYADMFGWQKMATEVSNAYNTLTPEEKTKCVFIGNNYGETGAIDFYRRKYDLPKAICGHNNYWLWGPGNATGAVVIRVGGTLEAMKESYSKVMQVGTFQDDYCMPYENNMPIWILKDRHSSLKKDWADFKNYQ
ncbi:MAG: glycosyltransferase family 39 protein [Ignavibacteriaceae bacterium]